MANKLTVVAVNCVTVRRHKAELVSLLERLKADVLCLCETRLSSKSAFNVRGYEVIRKDRNTQGGGVAVLVKTNLCFKRLKIPATYDQEESILLEISINDNKSIIIAAIYSPPNAQLPMQYFQHLAASYDILIITGDLNAASVNLGCPHDNQKHNDLENVVLSTNLIPLTVLDSSPTYHPYRENGRDQILDWMLVSQTAFDKVENYFIDLDSELRSDHSPIVGEYTFAPIRDVVPNMAPRLCFKRADWNLFHESLAIRAETLINLPTNTCNEINTLNTSVALAINETVNETVPIVTYRGPKKWWRFTPEMNYHKGRRNWHRRQAGKANDAAILREHRRWANYHTRYLSQLIAQSKAEGWERFCDGLQDCRNPGQFHKTFKIFKNGRLKQEQNLPRMEHGGKIARTSDEKAQLCADYLQDVFKTPHGAVFDQEHYNRVNNFVETHPKILKPINGPNLAPRGEGEELITEQELTPIIKRLKPSASGPDAIPNQVLKQLPSAFVKVLCKLFNASFDKGYLPDSWKQANLIMLPKGNKSAASPGNLRPISLLNTIGKLMERVLAARIRQKCEQDMLFLESQAGFRKGRSTEDHLFKLAQHCMDIIKAKKETLAVFLDIQKAFDSVWHNGLRMRLVSTDLPLRTVRWISNFLSNRKYRTRINGCLSEEFSSEAGVPQGSVISPLLYIIYVRDLVPTESAALSVAQYADDTALWANGSVNRPPSLVLQRGLDHVYQWCCKWRLVVNPGKTKVVNFTRRHRDRNIIVRYGPDQLEINGSVKFLGIMFDSRVNLSAHITTIRQKAMPMALLLRAFRGRTWSVPIKSLLMLYKMHIRSIMTYGAAALLCASDFQLAKLQLVQNAALRKILNLPPGTNTTGTQTLLGLESVKQRLLRLNRSYYKRNQDKAFLKRQVWVHNYYHRPGTNNPTPLEIALEN